MSLRRNHPVASFATHHTHNLELDNEEPVLLPDTPSHAPTPTPLLTRPPNVDLPNLESDDDEPVFVSRKLLVDPMLSREVELSGEFQAQTDLRNDLENAKIRIQALEDTIQQMNKCPCCLEVMLRPFILSCGHTYCKDCLETMSVLYLKASCRTIQGRFTPIPNYFIQQSVDNMLKVKGIPNPTCKPLQWPRAFRSGPMSFPFPRRSGTYPVAVSTAVPAPFPLPIFSIDDD
ncbi:MAG: hypothetical protein NXY57DRAFT_1037805 [Lentinula lateritia]|nr:MAG: hypothetical protein NXY57DRAFT_1037805 [Lentinula lateritia]